MPFYLLSYSNQEQKMLMRFQSQENSRRWRSATHSRSHLFSPSAHDAASQIAVFRSTDTSIWIGVITILRPAGLQCKQVAVWRRRRIAVRFGPPLFQQHFRVLCIGPTVPYLSGGQSSFSLNSLFHSYNVLIISQSSDPSVDLRRAGAGQRNERAGLSTAHPQPRRRVRCDAMQRRVSSAMQRPPASPLRLDS